MTCRGINENACNPKALFTAIDHLLVAHHHTELSLPNCQKPNRLAESFGVFFQSMIAKIGAGPVIQTVD